MRKYTLPLREQMRNIDFNGEGPELDSSEY